MEIISISSQSVVINTKKVNIAIDPKDNISDLQAVILTKEDGNFESENTLVIEGPGEYETNGVSIKGTRQNLSTVYQIESTEGNILFFGSKVIDKIQDSEDYDAVVIKVEEKIDDSKISSLSGLVILFGDSDKVSAKSKEQKLSKVSLKKRDKLTGNIVFLSK